MPGIIDAVIGLQVGDEGKGAESHRRNADPRYAIAIRPTGGDNAGHTAYVDGKRFALRQIPTGILHGKTSVLGSAMCVNPLTLMEEIAMLEAGGFDTRSLLISDRASLLLPWHIAEDQLHEDMLGEARIGTTQRGIGPCYRDDCNRSGLRLSHFTLPWEECRTLIARKLDEAAGRIAKLYPSFAETRFRAKFHWGALERARERLAPVTIDLPEFIRKERSRGRGILIEGAQGAMLDLRYGTYPYVTSSHPGVLGCLEGTGIAPRDISNVIGVLKGYATRVGGGPFPSRMDPATEQLVQTLGREKGTTTGRDRHCGWLDFVQLQYAARLNGVTGIVVTKFDFLHKLSELKVCVGYRKGTELITHVPADLEGIEAVLADAPKWRQPIGEARCRADLPENCVRYLSTIERTLEIPIIGLSRGPNPDDTVAW